MLHIGWNSNSFTSHRLEDAIPMLGDWGYSAIAITPDVAHLDPRYTTSAEVRRVGALCEQYKLKVVVETGARFSLSATQKHRPNLLEADDSRDLRLKYLRALCEWCDLLGAGVLSFWSGALPVDQTIKGARECLMSAVDNLSPLAQKYGAKLALEPEPGHFVATLDDYALAESRSSGAFGLSLDVGHLLVNDTYSPPEAIQKFADHILNIQLDDMPCGEHAHCPPCEGDMNWPALQEALARFGASNDTPACWELARDGHRFHELARDLRQFI